MFGWMTGKKKTPSEERPEAISCEEATHQATPASAPSLEPKTSWLKRLASGLRKTQQRFFSPLVALFTNSTTLNADFYEELERLLLEADMGLAVTEAVLDHLKKHHPKEPQEALLLLKQHLCALLAPCQAPPFVPQDKPCVVLLVGVNGHGKTTTCAKLAARWTQEGHKVLLAAGDTFRAAAVQQLAAWAQRLNLPLIQQPTGADSAALLFDALSAATARDHDILLADTAGRLHTRDDLMNELHKIVRVLRKQNAQAPHEIWLVVDATMGQNALNQALAFHQALGLTGVCLTKLDGTAKGGMIFALAEALKLPFRFLGLGEQPDDLQPFEADAFVNQLLDTQASNAPT